MTGQGLASYPQGERHSSYTVIESILPGSQPTSSVGAVSEEGSYVSNERNH